MPSDKPITTACDACRRRKVKCNGEQPCDRCENAGLTCRTTIARRKKGRQGATATVLRELRQAAETLETQTPSPQAKVSHHQFFKSEISNPTIVKSCADYFFARMLGTVPILLPTTFQSHVDRMAECPHSCCLVTAFCAFVCMQTGYTSCDTLDNSKASLGRSLLDEALAARRHLDPFAAPSRNGITIAFLLYGCQIGMGNQRQAYYFLREATTLYTAGILDRPDARGDEDAGNLFWLLVISERAHAIRRHRPITLQITPDSPILDDNKSDGFSIGFRCLADLYRPFDQKFLARWNGTDPTLSREVIIQLEDHLQQAVPADLELPDILLADLRVSQQWLRTMIWQLATSAGFLSSTPSNPCLGFGYPLEIARDLSLATWKLSKESLETHGVGLVEKIFEITCTLTDVMACMPPAGVRSSSFDLGPQDYLKHFGTLIHGLPGGSSKYLPLLLSKIGQTLPSMLVPLTRHLGMADGDLENHVLPENDMGSPIGLRSEWNKGLNWAEMSRIGDKTPELERRVQLGEPSSL